MHPPNEDGKGGRGIRLPKLTICQGFSRIKKKRFSTVIQFKGLAMGQGSTSSGSMGAMADARGSRWVGTSPGLRGQWQMQG